MRLWDANDARVLRTFAGHTGRVNRVLLLPGGRQALSASWDKPIRLWDLASSAPLRGFTGHTGWVMGLAMVGNNRLLSSSADHTLRMWDLAGGQTIRVYEGHDDLVTCVATTADGKRALPGSRDGTLRLWDLSSGRTLRVLRGHGHWLNEVVLLAAGRLALSASEDRTLRLWELIRGAPRHPAPGGSAPRNRGLVGRWSRSRRSLGSGTGAASFGLMRAWSPPNQRPPHVARARAAGEGDERGSRGSSSGRQVRALPVRRRTRADAPADDPRAADAGLGKQAGRREQGGPPPFFLRRRTHDARGDVQRECGSEERDDKDEHLCHSSEAYHITRRAIGPGRWCDYAASERGGDGSSNRGDGLRGCWARQECERDGTGGDRTGDRYERHG